MPGRSMGRGGGSFDSVTTRRVSATATTLTGRLTRKIQRQPKLAVSRPPMIGPTADAAPATADQAPKAIPRSRPSKVLLIRAIVVANIAAAPRPCTPRAASSTATLGATPQVRLDRAN